MNKKKVDFGKLFFEKEYSKIISIIERIPEEEKNSGILNLQGVCKMALSHSNDSLESAINDFRKSYLKEKNSTNSTHALRNLINAAVILFDNKFKDELKIDKKIFEEIFEYYYKDKILFEKSTPHLLAIIKVFKRFLDLNSVISLLKKLVENEKLNSDALSSLCFFNNYMYSWKQSEYLKYSKLLNQILKKYSSNELIDFKINKGNKINLAFISSDIRLKHSITYFLKTVLTEYDKNKYRIYLYLNSAQEDETTKQFKKYVYLTRNITNLDNLSAINTIRNDEIDIMIDLNGFSSNHRLVLLKNRLAPIQISWCGYTNTTGLNEVDYLIADRNLINEKEEDLYSEKIIYLPTIWNCHSGYDEKRTNNNIPSNENKFITFGSFNNFLKINEEVIDVWSQILKKVENSKLILKTSIATSNDYMIEKFKKNGVLNSIEFLTFKKSFKDHLSLYKKIDIALDTFPWNGVTTSFEAIWMGVPVITMKGFNFNSRCGESINRNAKLENLIAENKLDYINKAVSLAQNKVELEKIRGNIYENALNTALFDKKKFSKSFFECIQKIYKK